MPAPTNPTIGYFTVIQDDRTGWTGGLLILNRGGRPVEFQCTLPVRPSRAHEILFGSTMRDHLIGEVIGPMLVSKCRTPMSLLCCDQVESLALNSRGDIPVALISEAAEGDEGPITSDMLMGASQVALVNATLNVPLERADVVEGLVKSFEDMPDAIEPFERIREAIREAQSQIARAA
ncbi:hypothetical protein Pla52o_21070 [Novipirellula galeiformis]|uniref:Uncharacterized protein n=1 Tax=Novipirellula galeiformis TaxID=2528004 RepID=A0A5C6CH00_9BACT|nr:hypothetical protein [Novipirellula galeiformis]TWU24183.1 hypothetical protein Pla52o_21070 [Novipirellula galeiformis]